MRIPIIAFAAVVLFGVTGASGQDALWSSARINNLPAEVRTAILARCPTAPMAGHYFATYFRDQIILHFDLFLCEDSKVSFCNGSRCLQQVYKFTAGHYRLAKSFYSSGNN